MFKYTLDNKRYHTLNYHYHNLYNDKVFKISLNGGFTCPNKDGSKGVGGCIYCSVLGSGDYAGDKNDDLITQFNKVKDTYVKKWPHGKYIGYFQANTNTYAPVSELKEKYELILKQPNVIGLNISTRADALSDECLEYLEELNTRTNLTVELGLQTIHDETSKLINRCHTLEEFTNAVARLREKKINVVVHIINGLPYETKEMMLATSNFVSKLDIQGIKIHMLHITKNTLLAQMYEEQQFPILTKEEYVNITVEQLENLRPEIVIHRITGDPVKEDLIAPLWLIKKFTVLNDIDKLLVKRNTYQGFNLSIMNYVKREIETKVKRKDLVIDATVGNGHDTLSLAHLASEGHVFGFDIQAQAIKTATDLLISNGINNVTLFQESHAKMADILSNYQKKISLIIFNLGYLPSGDKKVTTLTSSTIEAIKSSLTLLNNHGKILITVYPGHEEGLKESLALKHLVQDLQEDVKFYHNTNNPVAPYLIVISKKS